MISFNLRQCIFLGKNGSREINSFRVDGGAQHYMENDANNYFSSDIFFHKKCISGHYYLYILKLIL